MLGSSALTMTRPPFTPVSVSVSSGSAATLRPTCFMRDDAAHAGPLAPTAVSSATFSLTHHWAWMPSRLAAVSMISVEGVPG